MNDIQDKENSTLTKSPCILKPKPLYFRKKLKRVLTVQPLTPLDSNVCPSSTESLGYLLQSPKTCLNPFKCSINKRKRNLDDDKENGDFLTSENKIAKTEDTVDRLRTVVPALVNEDAHLGLNDQHFSSDCDSAQPAYCKQFPIDWSLKTKIRLTSSKPFPWRNSFKTSEEASGTTGFVRCHHSEDQKTRHLDSSHGAKFYQNCLIWMHPTIPWLNLFPRRDNQTVGTSPLPSLDSKFVEVLHSNWCDSFRSLYQLVRTCQCPYFYMCAPTFTVLFRSGGVGSIIDIHAAITPTTSGLRNALIEEGIEFTMPLNSEGGENGSGGDYKHINDNSSAVNETGANNLVASEECRNETGYASSEEEEEPGMWLESLGLSQQDFPSLNSLAVKRREERKKNIDHRPESMVYVDGAETQALVNFLLNYPSCVSKVGPMAGIPPTLLSPVAFLGATLQSHKVQHAKVQEKGTELNVVELIGPLLPNVIHSLSSLLNTTQDGNFSLSLTPLQSTLSFASLPHGSSFPSVFATENLKDCGLSSPFVQQMCSKDDASAVKPLTHVSAKNGLFSWT